MNSVHCLRPCVVHVLQCSMAHRSHHNSLWVSPRNCLQRLGQLSYRLQPLRNIGRHLKASRIELPQIPRDVVVAEVGPRFGISLRPPVEWHRVPAAIEGQVPLQNRPHVVGWAQYGQQASQLFGARGWLSRVSISWSNGSIAVTRLSRPLICLAPGTCACAAKYWIICTPWPSNVSAFRKPVATAGFDSADTSDEDPSPVAVDCS